MSMHSHHDPAPVAPSPATGADGWFWASDAPAEGPRIEMRHRADGGMDVRTSDKPGKVLEFTRAEWLAWLDGVAHREFDHLTDE
jgi:hypothetical protein